MRGQLVMPVARDAKKAWIELPDRVSVGEPFALKVQVEGATWGQVALTAPESSLVLRITDPLQPFKGDPFSTYGWSVVPCAAGDLTIPGVRVTGGSGEERWTVVTEPATLQVTGAVPAAQAAQLRTDLEWLAEPSDQNSMLTNPAAYLGLLFGFVCVAWVLIRRSRTQRTARAAGRSASAKEAAAKAIRAARDRHRRGDIDASEARDIAADAIRIFTGARVGAVGLSWTADELRSKLKRRGETALLDGVSRLVEESEAAKYGVARGLGREASESLLESLDSALSAIAQDMRGGA